MCSLFISCEIDADPWCNLNLIVLSSFVYLTFIVSTLAFGHDSWDYPVSFNIFDFNTIVLGRKTSVVNVSCESQTRLTMPRDLPSGSGR